MRACVCVCVNLMARYLKCCYILIFNRSVCCKRFVNIVNVSSLNLHIMAFTKQSIQLYIKAIE